jgi:regulator of cell morphogenesis and NO signaling
MTTTDSTFDFSTCTVADLALQFPQAIGIFNTYYLDYCCHGKTPFMQACADAGLNPHKIWQEIMETKFNQGPESKMRFETWDATLLIDYITQHHHTYVRESIPQIMELLNKISDVHGQDSPYVLTVRDTFNALAEELLNHLPKEEEILFPAIRRLLESSTPKSVAASIQFPISVMEHEHDSAGDLIKSLRSLTSQYTPPASACPTFQYTYKMLKEFDEDLMQHIHLENNILFPKAKM